MPYQPTHPHPYLESIDATSKSGHVFSVIINPKDIITSYDFYIYKIEITTDDNGNSTSQLTSIYSVTNQTPTEPYGSETGTLLPISVPANIEGFINGSNYQWKIVLYDATGASIESPLYYFSAKTTPKITLDVPETISTCEYEFKATYEQEQNEKYMHYQYSLYRNGVLIDSISEKMDSLLSYTYKGFISGENYRLDLTIVTTDRNTYKLSRHFSVEYSTQPLESYSIVTPVQDKNCIEVDYSQNLFIKGNTDGEITYENFIDTDDKSSFTGASIPENESIYYNKINEQKPLSLGDDFTVYYSVHFDDFFVGDIITLTDEMLGNTYNIRYDGRKFYYKINYGAEVAIDPYVDGNMVHQKVSVVQPSGTTINDINYDALYILGDEDIITNDSVILYNDITANFWWNFVLLPKKVLVYRGAKYSESEVS